MSVETPADRVAMLVDHGEAFTLTPAGGTALDLTGIFDGAFLETAERFGTGIAAQGIAVTVAADVLPAGTKRGDAVASVTRGTFTVAEVHPDGTGIVHLVLERAA